MLRSLVGSEMCIRDSINAEYGVLSQQAMDHSLQAMESPGMFGSPDREDLITAQREEIAALRAQLEQSGISLPQQRSAPCLLYTSDAADEEDSVDLGGRRIIKKKKKNMEKNRLIKRT
eukprot:TRINITY_DN9355_c0_g1_i7.p1 TRINITY_DN9355_c0_g1~~TRINITY_DN9355_c0_g1_i7.p1  ORF type:complete len:118 (+),score=43.34 TRINITY_DN9355_c0_g1_i7:148-501(+)